MESQYLMLNSTSKSPIYGLCRNKHFFGYSLGTCNWGIFMEGYEKNGEYIGESFSQDNNGKYKFMKFSEQDQER